MPPNRTQRRFWLASLLSLLAAAGASAQTSAPASSQPTKLGRYRSTLTDLVEPSAAAIRENEILVADSGNDRIVVFDREGRRLRTIGERGQGEGHLLRPGGVAIDHTGRIFIADTGNDRIVIVDPEGEPLGGWGSRGRENGEFCHPTAITISGDRVAVVDSDNERVQIFDRAGKHLLSISEDDIGQAGAPLGRIGGVALAPDGALYVSDNTRHRILVLAADGKGKEAWGDWGAFPGQFAAPGGLALHDGDLFVADTLNHRIQVLSSEGPTRYEWGLHAIEPRSGEGRLHYPCDVAVSADGEIAVVCEAFENRCQVFVRTAMSDRSVARLIPGNEGTAAHFGPRADCSGDYMALIEPESHTLLLYDATGPVPINITQIGGYGKRFGQFNIPSDVSLDAAVARLYALDACNRRLQMFTLRYPKEIGFSPLVASFAKAWSFEALDRAAKEAKLQWPLRADTIERDREGNFYLLDARNCAILVFDSSMQYTRRIGGYQAGPRTAPGLRRPTDFCVTPGGERVLVADADQGLVQMFDSGGRPGVSLGGAGDRTSELVEPSGVAISPDGNIYVTDRAAHRVLCFDRSGKFVRRWGSQGLGPGQFFKPTGVQVDSRGRVLVLDYGNHRAQYFTAEGEFLSVFGARFYIAPARRAAASREK